MRWGFDSLLAQLFFSVFTLSLFYIAAVRCSYCAVLVFLWFLLLCFLVVGISGQSLRGHSRRYDIGVLGGDGFPSGNVPLSF